MEIAKHDYNKPTAPIKLIYFFLVLISIIISIAISYYLKHLSANDFKGYLILIFAGTPWTIYGVLFWLFDRILWKVCLVNNLIKVPNLEGEYNGKLKSSYDNFKKAKNISIIIKQRFSKMIVIFKTETSESKSLNALLKKEEDKVLLIYNYQNEPNAVEEITLNEHKGTAWIKFDLDSSHFEGKYYTDKRPIESTKAVCNYGRIEGLKNSV